MKVIFLNEKTLIELDSYMISEDRVGLAYDGIKENFSGFILYDDKMNIVKDCSKFIYRWDVYGTQESTIIYTSSKEERQLLPMGKELKEYVDPLTNEELTVLVSDLLYETSLMKLGMEVE